MSSPVRFLYFHAIELFLKAYLRLQGLSEATIAGKYSHRLDELAGEAEDAG